MNTSKTLLLFLAIGLFNIAASDNNRLETFKTLPYNLGTITAREESKLIKVIAPVVAPVLCFALKLIECKLAQCAGWGPSQHIKHTIKLDKFISTLNKNGGKTKE
jgi:hypothetical protein